MTDDIIARAASMLDLSDDMNARALNLLKGEIERLKLWGEAQESRALSAEARLQKWKSDHRLRQFMRGEVP